MKPEASNSIDLAAVLAFAQYDKAPSDESGQTKAKELAESEPDNLTVQLLCGSVLARSGAREEALNLLSKHQGSLDAVALATQIHLSGNRSDLAAGEVRRARAWAQDSLLVNLAEAWTGMREGGSEKYQSAFYVFEELATAEATKSWRSQAAQAACEMHLGRWDEAEAAMTEALKMVNASGDAAKVVEGGKEKANVLANAVALNAVLGKEVERQELLSKLQAADGEHALVDDLRKKQELFEGAKGKYTPKFASELEA